MGLSILTSLEEGNVCRTIISGLLGLLLACIGLDPLLGVPRLTFGTRFLTSGIEMIPVMIGFFAVTEVLKQTNKPSKLKAVTGKDGKADMSAKMPTLKEMWSLKGVIARCSILGTASCPVQALPSLRSFATRKSRRSPSTLKSSVPAA